MSELTVSDFSTPLVSNANWIDALISGTSTANWNWLVPDRNTILYTFNVAPGAAAELGVSMFPNAAFNNVQRAAARDILGYVSTVTGLNFVETGSGDADLHFANVDLTDSGIAGEAVWRLSYEFLGTTVTRSTVGQYVFLDSREYLASNAAPVAASSGYEVLLHEIGHTLGLKHPFEEFPTLVPEQDNTSKTVMSYTHVGGPYSTYNELDLAALAYLYGFDGMNGNWGVGSAGRYYRGTSANETFTSSAGVFAWVGLDGEDVLTLQQPLRSSSFFIGPANAYIVVDQTGSTNYVAASTETLVFPDNTIRYPELLRGLQVALSTQFGTSSADALTGTSGNDVFFGRGANDSASGLAGVDTALYLGPRASYSLIQSGAGNARRADVADSVPGRDGSDTLLGIERLKFADVSVALDLDAAAGWTAKLIGALFGSLYVHDRTIVGLGLQLFDAGLTYEQVAARAASDPFFAQLAGSHSNADFVRYVYRNVTGVLPSAEELNLYVGLLDAGVHTQGSLAVVAAETPANQLNIGLLGLQQFGLEYA